LINALEYGVPQNRDRAIAIGFKSNLVAMKSSDELEAQFPWDINKLFSIDKIQSYPWSKTDPFEENSSLTCPAAEVLNDRNSC
jgi:DNA (cytosine-5)-methyltransferase 1